MYVRMRAYLWVSGRVGMSMRVCAFSLAYSACNAYVSYCDVICGPSGSTKFFYHCIINGAIFGEKVLNVKCVFRFSLQLLYKTFLILGRI
jgi:hypothetical protein